MTSWKLMWKLNINPMRLSFDPDDGVDRKIVAKSILQ